MVLACVLTAVAALPAVAVTPLSFTTLTVYNRSHGIVGSVTATGADEEASPFAIYTVSGVAGDATAYRNFSTIFVNGAPTDIVGVTTDGFGNYFLSFAGHGLASAIGGKNPIAYTGEPIDVSRFIDPRLGDTAILTLSAPVTAQLVPEPAAWTLLIAGFGLVGLAARRRRAAVA